MAESARLSSAHCLLQAEECRRLAADRNVSEGQRTMLEYIADTWERLSKSTWGAR